MPASTTRTTRNRSPARSTRGRSTRRAGSRPGSRPRSRGTSRSGRMAGRSGGRSTRTRAAPGQRDIQRFLDQFTASLTAGDGEACAACFEYPALMVMSDSRRYGPSQPLQDEQAVAEFFSKAPAMYHERGIEDTFANVESVEWLADDLALVRAQFPYIDADGNDLGDGESSLYLIRRTGDDLAIAAAITLGVDSDRQGGRRNRRTR